MSERVVDDAPILYKKILKALKKHDLPTFDNILCTSSLTRGFINIVMCHGSLPFIKCIETHGAIIHTREKIHDAIMRGFTSVVVYQLSRFIRDPVYEEKTCWGKINYKACKQTLSCILGDFVNTAHKHNRTNIANLLVNKYRARVYVIKHTRMQDRNTVFYTRTQIQYLITRYYQEQRHHIFNITYLFLPKDFVKWMVRFVGICVKEKS